MKMRVPGIKVHATDGLDKFYHGENKKALIYLVVFVPVLLFLLILFILAMLIGTTAPTGLNLPYTPEGPEDMGVLAPPLPTNNISPAP